MCTTWVYSIIATSFPSFLLLTSLNPDTFWPLWRWLKYFHQDFLLWRLMLSCNIFFPSEPLQFVCFVDMDVKLHRLLLGSRMNYSRMSSVGKRLFSSFCSRFGGNQTLILFGGPLVAHQLRRAAPPGNRKLPPGLLSRSYGDVGSNSTCCQGPVLLRSLPRWCQSAAGLRKEILLRGGAAWPGKIYTD